MPDTLQTMGNCFNSYCFEKTINGSIGLSFTFRSPFKLQNPRMIQLEELDNQSYDNSTVDTLHLLVNPLIQANPIHVSSELKQEKCHDQCLEPEKTASNSFTK